MCIQGIGLLYVYILSFNVGVDTVPQCLLSYTSRIKPLGDLRAGKVREVVRERGEMGGWVAVSLSVW